MGHHDDSSLCIIMMHHRDSLWWVLMLHDEDLSWCIMIMYNDDSSWIMMNHCDSSWWIIMMHHGDASRWSSLWITTWPWKDSFQGCHGPERFPFRAAMFFCCHGCHQQMPHIFMAPIAFFRAKTLKMGTVAAEELPRKPANCTSPPYRLPYYRICCQSSIN